LTSKAQHLHSINPYFFLNSKVFNFLFAECQFLHLALKQGLTFAEETGSLHDGDFLNVQFLLGLYHNINFQNP